MAKEVTPALEHEFKFLLRSEQYRHLWCRLIEKSKLRLQENFFYDRDELLRGNRWALRLRLEREPSETYLSDSMKEPLASEALEWQKARAYFTLKGPVLDRDQGVVRPETEEEVDLIIAAQVRSSGLVRSSQLPTKICITLLNRVTNGQPLPDMFYLFISFFNLRLCWNITSANTSIEVALDRSHRADGGIRYELEVEWEGQDLSSVREILSYLDTDSYRPTTHGKLAWAMSG